MTARYINLHFTLLTKKLNKFPEERVVLSHLSKRSECRVFSSRECWSGCVVQPLDGIVIRLVNRAL